MARRAPVVVDRNRNPSRSDENRPDRTEYEERTVRNVGLERDPPRHEEHGKDDAGSECPRRDTRDGSNEPEHQADPAEELDVTDTEGAGLEWQRADVQQRRDDERDQDRRQQLS